MIYIAAIWRIEGRVHLPKIPAKWLIIGPFGYFFYWLGFLKSFASFTAYSGTASETTVLNYTWPIFTLLFYNIIIENNNSKLHFMEYLSIALSFSGVVLLATQGRLVQPGNLAGIGWGLFAGASYGLFSAYSRTLSSRQQPAFLLVSVGISIALTILLIFVNQVFMSAPPLHLSTNTVGLAAISGLLIDGLGYLLWTAALTRSAQEGISLGKIATRMYLLPLLSLGWVALWFGEKRLTDSDFALSAGLIVAGQIVSSIAPKSAPH